MKYLFKPMAAGGTLVAAHYCIYKEIIKDQARITSNNSHKFGHKLYSKPDPFRKSPFM